MDQMGGPKVDSVTVTATQCSFGWTHCLRLHGICELVLCSLCLNDFLTVMFCCADERRGRNRPCTTSSRLDAHRKFTLYCFLLQWSVQSGGSATVTKLAENQKTFQWCRTGCINCELLQRVRRTDIRFRSVP